jgi:ATP-dependent DNA helicase RecG
MPASLLDFIKSAEQRIKNAKGDLDQWYNFIYGGNEGILRTLDQSMQSDFNADRILNTLYKSKDVEMFGSGFKKVYAICRQSGVKTEYRSGYGGFSFIFIRDNVTDRVTDYIPVRKIPTYDAVLELLKENPTYSREKIANRIGKSVRTVQRALDKLTEEGKIKRIGNTRAGYWEVLQ